MTPTPTLVSVRPAEPPDATRLADLLSRNRDYFRSGEPKRRDAYYTLDAQRRIIEQAVESMPAGPIDAGDFIPIPAGEACARIEGPRGEVFYYVASDGSDVPLRVRIRTPTFQNMPTVALMVREQTLADVPLIQASIDPCYSCTDR